MKNLVIVSLLGFGLCLASPLSARPRQDTSATVQNRNPSTTQRVHFARGKSSAVVSGVAGFENWEPLDNYIVQARAGQVLIVRLLSGRGKVQFDVYKAGNRSLFASSGGEDTTLFRSKLRHSGDYVVSVYGIKKHAHYKVEIKID